VIELIGPVVMCFAAVFLATLVVSTIDSFVPTEHLMLGYLLPIIFVAIYFGSTLAVLTSFASGLAVAYFLLPPKFSFYVDDPVHIAELGFTIVLAAANVPHGIRASLARAGGPGRNLQEHRKQKA
jgi:K+-sensing histidine kinase KdpD